MRSNSVVRQPTKREQLAEQYPDHQLELLDGFDDCLLGVSIVSPGHPSRVPVYSLDACVKRLQEDLGMGPDEARDYFLQTIGGASIEDTSPLIIAEEGEEEQ